jgi:antagonist of KipI
VGDRLPVGNPVATAEGRISFAPPVHPRRAQEARECVLRVLPAPDLERFENDAFDVLLSAPYVVRTESNRMGYRLRGPKLGLLGGADGPLSVPGSRISDVTPIGLIQVPPSGDPVLLMADRPTTGGYAGIANVITADIDLAAQLAPGDACRFAPCSVDDALDAVFDRERDLERVERRA